MLRWSAAVCLLALPQVGLADSRACATCHAKIYATYAKSAMSRSFSKATAVPELDHFYHPASETHLRVFQRDGRYFQRRWQTGFGGSEANVDEKSIDYVMGSGNHVRTYLHSTSTGAVQQLPLAWYSENGGHWAMNPGYDNPEQPNSRRKINYECMGCHNAYPTIPQTQTGFRAEPLYSAPLPEGIDCQRCHGPGTLHLAKPTAANIVNPRRLAPERQMEVCMQCHLETTSFPFPHSVEKFDKPPFTYQPGQVLGDYLSFFDHAPSPPASMQKEDRFQIVNSVYRLRMSQCFLKSGTKLQCSTCHDPHDPGGRDPNQACRDCHTQLPAKHPEAPDCTSCHMPKRRTDDVVHAVLTDHLIRRRPPEQDLLAAKAEPGGAAVLYRGEAIPYYPAKPEALSTALAQVRFDVNPGQGIDLLREAIRRSRPDRTEYTVELADALRRNGRPQDAVPVYRQATRLNSQPAWIGLGQAFDALNSFSQAAAAFFEATKITPTDPFAWQLYGQALMRATRAPEAHIALNKSLELDPEAPEAHYARGLLFVNAGQDAQAETAFREAIRLQPDFSAAQLNLAIALSRQQKLAEAEFHYLRALHYRPDYALAHRNYGLMLQSSGRSQEAEIQLRQAAR